jgi:hypothetical protein
MEKMISIEKIKRIDKDYSFLSNVVTDISEQLPVKQWVEKYRKLIHANDILYLIVRREFMSEKDIRLFHVWMVKEALKLIDKPDKRIVEVCDVAERYANGEATKEELLAAHADAIDAYLDVIHNIDNDEYNLNDYYDAVYATYAAAYAAIYASDTDADHHAAPYVFDDYHIGDSHIDKLLTYL